MAGDALCVATQMGEESKLAVDASARAAAALAAIERQEKEVLCRPFPTCISPLPIGHTLSQLLTDGVVTTVRRMPSGSG